MSISFYDTSVGTYQQVLGSVAAILDKGAAFAAESEINLEDIVATKLHDDMMPFHFQIVSVCHHSWGALQGMREENSHHLPSKWIEITRGCRRWLAKRRRVWHPFRKAMRLVWLISRWSLRSEIARCRLRIRTSCCLFRSQTSTSTPRPPTTYCACWACRWVRGIFSAR